MLKLFWMHKQMHDWAQHSVVHCAVASDAVNPLEKKGFLWGAKGVTQWPVAVASASDNKSSSGKRGSELTLSFLRCRCV
ncbi:hypothetical protein I79_003905 [Cricetulus griseus]|uniref:Uncharacterized protein n=1 Tax=Cricetulus griseus TaxID=10029 RepID=G3H182_CRIGR|nr:hypothetical protein I79_003905 [Cricetulus griseus]